MRVWLLNLDADRELAAAGSYAPPRALSHALASATVVAAHQLVRPPERVLDGGQVLEGAWRGASGRCFCPTPSALARLQVAGARPEPAPPVEVLRRTNHRRFCLELGGCAPGAFYVADAAGLTKLLSLCRARRWLAKRPHGFAGRGQRRLLGSPSPDDERWLAGALKRGGFVAEPWLDLTRELCLHGALSRKGELELGRLCEQQVDAHGAWQATRLADDDVERRHGDTFRAAARRVARALSSTGYFGPFGIDGYEYAIGKERRGHPLGEINARYSMGYGVGMGWT